MKIAGKTSLLTVLVLGTAATFAQTGIAQEGESFPDDELTPISEAVPAQATTDDPEANLPNDIEPEPNWVDTSHTYAADTAQSMTEWMDDFFGDPTYDAERAESFLRLELEDDWESEDGHDLGVKLRGKVQLPKISKRDLSPSRTFSCRPTSSLS